MLLRAPRRVVSGLACAGAHEDLDRLASQTGLPVYVSEYDLDLADDARQQQVMQSQFTMFWSHPQVRGITLWGYVSGATWKPSTGLMSANGPSVPRCAGCASSSSAE